MKQEEDGISYFWDSYAIIELENGNEKYLKYSDYPVILALFNLAEVYWVILNQLGEKEADKVYDDYRPAVVEIDDETLKEAIKFRKKVYKNKKISYIDAIGYIYVLRNNLVFLTGDEAFEDLENVEFVKK